MEEAGCGRKCIIWLEKGRCTLLINVGCWRISDWCWLEMNLATPICWGCYQILNIGLSVSMLCFFCSDSDLCCALYSNVVCVVLTAMLCIDSNVLHVLY